MSTGASSTRAGVVGAAVVTAALGVSSVLLVGTDATAPPLGARPAAPTTTTTTTATTAPVAPPERASTTTSSSAAPATTTDARPTTTTAPPRRQAPFEGLGTWLDVLDWSPTYTEGRVAVTPDDVEAMADRGVDVLFIQTARFNRPEDVLDPAVLRSFIDRAHAHGMDVVAWYLPTFTDPATDLRRLLAAASLDVEAIAVDIESTELADVELRSERLVRLGEDLDRQLPDVPIGAIVLPPVVTELLSDELWPDFPWSSLPDSYDVVLPMGYWTNRTPASGWLDGERYTTRNVELVRSLTGDPAIPVHAVGGIADVATVEQVAAMVRACTALRLVGCSMYDEATMRDELWLPLRSLALP